MCIEETYYCMFYCTVCTENDESKIKYSERKKTAPPPPKKKVIIFRILEGRMYLLSFNPYARSEKMGGGGKNQKMV